MPPYTFNRFIGTKRNKLAASSHRAFATASSSHRVVPRLLRCCRFMFHAAPASWRALPLAFVPAQPMPRHRTLHLAVYVKNDVRHWPIIPLKSCTLCQIPVFRESFLFVKTVSWSNKSGLSKSLALIRCLPHAKLFQFKEIDFIAYVLGNHNRDLCRVSELHTRYFKGPYNKLQQFFIAY